MKRAFERTAAAVASRFTILHTTAASEAATTARRMPGFPFAILPNSVEIPLTFERRSRTGAQTRLMFLSRVHEKKGLSLLLDAMSQLPDEIVLDIYGTGEETYLRQLRSEINKVRLGERVIFHGHVDGAMKTKAFAKADIFVLPSYSENFGIVVAEALAHGLPVITTDRTPWSALDEKGCGLCVPPEALALKKAIAKLATVDLDPMGARGRSWMEQDFSPSSTHAKMYDLYEAAIAAQRTGQPIRTEQIK
ncbi:glycosyltransferase [bacterium]|nr:glycosyltransferase [bacterium]